MKGLNFFRLIVLGFAVVLVGTGICFADDAANEGLVIGSVKTVGNRAISSTEILGKVRSRAGQLFDGGVAAEDAKRIAELAGVEYCYYSTAVADGRIELAFVVVEKNVIRAVVFEGNRDIKDKSLAREVRFKEGDYLDPVLAEVGRRGLLDFYRDKGYAFAQVSLDESQLSQGMLVYRIEEGPRVKISAVEFEGNKAIGTGSLKSVTKTRGRKFFVFSTYYDKRQVSDDVTKLQKAYQRKGYLDAQIKAEPRFNDEKDRVMIVFVIDERLVYKIKEIVVSGHEDFGREQVLAELKSQQGQVYSERKVTADTKRLYKLYHENGFVDAAIEHSREFVAEGLVRARFDITAGEQFRIGRIVISGNEQTQDKVVRRVLDEYDFKPGYWYNADIVRGDGTGQLEKTVRRTVMAESLTISASDESPGQKDVQVNMTEGQTGMLMVGAGVASDSGFIGQFVFEQGNFDIEDRPESLKDLITAEAFKGAGQSLRIALQPGTEVSEYSVTFNEPYYQDRPISLDLVGTSYERVFESYDEGRTRGFVGFEKREKDRWRRSIGIRAENVEVDDIDEDAPQEIFDVEGNNFLSGVRVGFGRDLTDDRFNPTSGDNFRVSYEQVFGDYDFGVISGTYRQYKTIYEDLAERKTIFAFKLHAASIVGDAPLFEKFYAGGQNSIRGFDYRGVSPRGFPVTGGTEATDPIGSDWVFLANGEVTIPLVGESLAALFFVDSGTIETGPYRVALGGGIQIMIPQVLGPVPMRFEFAAPLIKDDEDDTQTFSFSVGRLF